MNKIEALKKTIYNLENDVYKYNWSDANSCNCGVLAKSILNTNKSVFEIGYDCAPLECMIPGIFSKDFAHCEMTGLPMPATFKALRDVGFTYKELHNLEYLGGSTYSYADKNCLTAYLKQWVATLEAAQPAYSNISKSLAVLPVNETSDVINQPVKI